MDVDVEGNRLFIAALGNGSLEVVDIEHHRHLQHVVGLREPQGVRFMKAAARLYVANGGSGTVNAFDADSLALLATIQGLEDADNVRVDVAGEHLYVGYNGGLAVVDPNNAKLMNRIPLGGHPESFQIENSGSRIYANLPSAQQVIVVDRGRGAVQSRWALKGAGSNYPMALDEQSHRLFIVTRRPARLLVLDTDTGKEVARLSTCGDSDDAFFDGTRRQLYVICGEGEVDVVRASGRDGYDSIGRVKTRPGARTGLYVPSRSALFVAAPAQADSAAAVLVFKVR